VNKLNKCEAKMSKEKLEVLLTSDSSGQMFNMCVWDPTTGTSLKIYKGNTTRSKTCCIIGNTFLISSQVKQPLLNVWQLNKHEQKPLKYITPGNLQSMAVSPCGHILIGTVDERIYVWQTSSGKLLRIISNGHYQKINLTKFTSDGSHFVTAGEDGNVILWHQDSSKPRHVWSHHTLGITDFHLGTGGLKSRIFTASKDQTVKVYCVASGQFLLDIEFDSKLTALAIDSAEENGFVGTNNGLVYKISLTNPPRDLKMSMSPNNKNTFKGHTKEISCISVSLDGLNLATGSADNDVRIWHVQSCQCIKVIPHKGLVTTLSYMIPKLGMLEQDSFVGDMTFSLLEKTVADKNIALSDLYAVDIITNNQGDETKKEPKARQLIFNGGNNSMNTNQNNSSDSNEDDNMEIKKLKNINHKLYEAAVKAILKE